MKRIVTLTIVLLGGLLAGCGESGPTNEEQVRENATSFTKAMAAQDQPAACDLLTSELRSEYQMGNEYGCGKSFGPIGNPDDWEDLKVESIQVDGPKATVIYSDFSPRLDAPQARYQEWVGCDVFDSCGPKFDDYNLAATLQTLSLAQDDGEWKISEVNTFQPE